jgi:hypothetical protein
MSHGLINTALALAPFIADAEGRYWQAQWSETHFMRKRDIYLKFTDFYRDYYANSISTGS